MYKKITILQKISVSLREPKRQSNNALHKWALLTLTIITAFTRLRFERVLNSLPTRQVGQVLVRVEPCIKVGVERVSLAKDLVGQSASRPDVRLGVVQHAAQPRLRTFDFRRHHRAVASLVHLSRQVRKLQSIRLVGQAAAEITDHQERVVYGKERDVGKPKINVRNSKVHVEKPVQAKTFE